MASGPGVDSDTAIKLRNSPSVSQPCPKHRFPHQRDHAVAAAKGQRADHEEIPEKFYIDHGFFSPFRSCCTAYTSSPAAPLNRM